MPGIFYCSKVENHHKSGTILKADILPKICEIHRKRKTILKLFRTI